MIDDVQWFVGIDWATQSHRACLLDVEGRHVSEHDFAHDGWAGQLGWQTALLTPTSDVFSHAANTASNARCPGFPLLNQRL